MTVYVPPIFVQTSTRADAEQLAWSLLVDEVRLAFQGDVWCVRVIALDVAATVEAVERCVHRLRLGPVIYLS